MTFGAAGAPVAAAPAAAAAAEACSFVDRAFALPWRSLHSNLVPKSGQFLPGSTGIHQKLWTVNAIQNR